MAKKKKTEKVGTIKAIDMIHASKPIQDIPFRTGAHVNKKYKREKVNKRNYDRYMQYEQEFVLLARGHISYVLRAKINLISFCIGGIIRYQMKGDQTNDS